MSVLADCPTSAEPQAKDPPATENEGRRSLLDLKANGESKPQETSLGLKATLKTGST